MLKQYQADGLQLIAVPCNQFGGQAPHSSSCERAYQYRIMGLDGEGPRWVDSVTNITWSDNTDLYPVLDKVDANGDNEAPFYTFLKAQSPISSGVVHPGVNSSVIANHDVQWNFEKFLVDEEGNVIGRYTPDVDVRDLRHEIEQLLNKPSSKVKPGDGKSGAQHGVPSAVVVVTMLAFSFFA